MLMMRKIKKYIMHSAEDKVLNIDQKDIEQYLSEVKEAVEKDNYRLDRNARRQDNINLFLDYVIDETKAKEIILSLTVMDFSEILQNEHKGFEHEKTVCIWQGCNPFGEEWDRRKNSISVYQV